MREDCPGFSDCVHTKEKSKKINRQHKRILLNKVKQAALVMNITNEHMWVYLESLGIEKNDKDALSLLEENIGMASADIRSLFLEAAYSAFVQEASYDRNGMRFCVKPAKFFAGWKILTGRTPGRP